MSLRQAAGSVIEACLPEPWALRVLPTNADRAVRLLEQRIGRHYRWTVASGLFEGMRYLESATGSVLAPKLLGTYEHELYDDLDRLLADGPGKVVDVGCAEGYFAVGCRHRSCAKGRPVPVVAVDLNPRAVELTRRLASHNDLADGVDVREEHWTPATLQERLGSGDLVVCDIEGGERDLLDPDAAPVLRSCAIVVEVHELPDLAEPMKGLLEHRFAGSHELTFHEYQGRRGGDHRALLEGVIPERWWGRAVEEGRPYGRTWFVMRPKG